MTHTPYLVISTTWLVVPLTSLAQPNKYTITCIPVLDTGSEAVNATSFGSVVDRIWLDRVRCTGSERELGNCLADSNGDESCTHAQDAGVRCQPLG